MTTMSQAIIKTAAEEDEHFYNGPLSSYLTKVILSYLLPLEDKHLDMIKYCCPVYSIYSPPYGKFTISQHAGNHKKSGIATQLGAIENFTVKRLNKIKSNEEADKVFNSPALIQFHAIISNCHDFIVKTKTKEMTTNHLMMEIIKFLRLEKSHSNLN